MKNSKLIEEKSSISVTPYLYDKCFTVELNGMYFEGYKGEYKSVCEEYHLYMAGHKQKPVEIPANINVQISHKDLIEYMIRYRDVAMYALEYYNKPNVFSLHNWCQAWEKSQEEE